MHVQLSKIECGDAKSYYWNPTMELLQLPKLNASETRTPGHGSQRSNPVSRGEREPIRTVLSTDEGKQEI